MDSTFANVIYLDKGSTRFAFIFILLFLLIPNISVIIGLFLLVGEEIIRNSSILLPLGLYTIFNFTLIILSFFALENNKGKTIRVLDEGLIYTSMLKKFAIPWNCVNRVRINPFSSARSSVMVETTKGRFYFTGMFVNLGEELPKIKPGFIKPKFYYPSGGEFNGKLQNSELLMVFREKVPEKFF